MGRKKKSDYDKFIEEEVYKDLRDAKRKKDQEADKAKKEWFDKEWGEEPRKREKTP